MALLHDVGGLLAARRAGAELTIVCLNNDGGGIFDFLPVAEQAEREAYERHIATPHWIDLADRGGAGAGSSTVPPTSRASERRGCRRHAGRARARCARTARANVGSTARWRERVGSSRVTS